MMTRYCRLSRRLRGAIAGACVAAAIVVPSMSMAALWLELQPDPAELVLEGAGQTNVMVIRHGSSAGDLNVAINVNLQSSNTNLFGVPLSILCPPSGDVDQTNLVTITGQNAGVGQLVALASGYVGDTNTVRVFPYPYRVSLPGAQTVVAGASATISVERQAPATNGLPVLITVIGGGGRLYVQGDSGVPQEVDTVMISTGSYASTFLILGVVPTVPDVIYVTASAPGYQTSTCEVSILTQSGGGGAPDDDKDGLPDWWENLYFTNTTTMGIEGQTNLVTTNWITYADGYTDYDADGLNDFYEYLAGTDPTDGVSNDGMSDPDGDLLYSIEEQWAGSHAGLLDTDDDGVSDLLEVWSGTAPVNSLDDFFWRTLHVPNVGSAMIAYDQAASSLLSFTAGAWVRPATTNGGMILRKVRDDGQVNFQMGLGTGNRPYLMFQRTFGPSWYTVVTPGPGLPLDKWSYVAVSRSDVSKQLRVMWWIETEADVYTRYTTVSNSLVVPATGRGYTMIGGNSVAMIGELDEVRVWDRTLSVGELESTYLRTIGWSEILTGIGTNLVSYYRFDDGGSRVEDFVHPILTNTLVVPSNVSAVVSNRIAAVRFFEGLRYVGVLAGGASFTNNVGAIGEDLYDGDGDGLPDYWESLKGLSPNSASGSDGADGDPDGDGLSNLYEYLADLADPVGVSPFDPDTDHDGDSDYDEDSDGDGLSNGDEQDKFFTEPGTMDSDDDGYVDGEEIDNRLPATADAYGVVKRLTSPIDSMSPYIPRCYIADGRGLAVPYSQRFAFTKTLVGGPEVTITSPANGSSFGVRYAQLEGTIQSDLSLKTVRIYNNDRLVKDLGVAYTFSETVILGVGANVLKVLAIDSQGGTGQGTVTVVGNFPAADIRVTQTWSQPGDLDTWVVDPLGRHMGWSWSGPGYPANGSGRIPGAMLDIDDVRGMGPENITIAQGYAVGGNYEIWMNNWGNQNNPESTVRILIKEGTPDERYVEFGPKSMPISDYNGQNSNAWWHVTTLSWPSGTMNPAGVPVDASGSDEEDPYHGLTANRGWTVECWILATNTVQTGAIAAYRRSNGQELFVVGLETNKPFVRMAVLGGKVYQVTGESIPTNEWTHLAFVYSESQKSLRLHINGVLGAAQQVLESRKTDLATLTLDTYFDGATNKTFNGVFLDELRFWYVARNGGLIADNMQQLADVSGSLAACYHFDDGGRSVEDAAAPMELNKGVTVIEPRPGSDAVVFGNNYYELVTTTEVTWAQAQILAAAVGGHLVDINSAEENDFVRQQIELLNMDYALFHIGCSDAAVEGEWRWSDGTLVGEGYDNWVTWMRDGIQVVEPATWAASLDYGDISSSWPQSELWTNTTLNAGEWFAVPGDNQGFYIIEFEGADMGKSMVPWRARLKYALGRTLVNGAITNLFADVVTNAAPGVDGLWGTADDVGVVSGVDGQCDYLSAVDPAPTYGLIDSDSDGLADWWEDLFGSYGTDSMSALGDPDGDTLQNVYEYLANCNPLFDDSDGDGTYDAEEDFDGDGLSNVDEQDLGSDPGAVDTDDDGVRDGAEVAAGSDVIDSTSPYVQRVLDLDGNGYVLMPAGSDADRLRLRSFTIESWIYIESVVSDAVIVQRQVGLNQNNFKLAVTNIGGEYRPYVRVTPENDQTKSGANDALAMARAGFGIPSNAWVHVAATLDRKIGQIWLFVNGERMATAVLGVDAMRYGVGPMFARVGEHFNGYLDEVRIWGLAKDAASIQAGMHSRVDEDPAGLPSNFAEIKAAIDAGTETPARLPALDGISGGGLLVYYRFDDAGKTVENYTFDEDWLKNWVNAGVFKGSAVVSSNFLGTVPVQGVEEDADRDGLPDTWEIRYFGGIAVTDGTGDYEGDGLTDLYEYLAGTHPRLMDTDGDDVLDKNEDADGDGLSNIKEQVVGTHPGRVDTDDDTYGDKLELDALPKMSPLHSMGAYVVSNYSLALTNVPLPGIEVPQLASEAAQSFRYWSVEAWFISSVPANQTGSLVSKMSGLRTGFELGVVSGVPYVLYQTTDGSSVVCRAAQAVPADQWTHLVGTWDPDAKVLRLYVNVVSVFFVALADHTVYDSADVPAQGFGQIVMGRSGTGWTDATRIDNVRIWNTTLIQNELDEYSRSVVSAGTDSRLLRDFRFDDGGVLIEDFAHVGNRAYMPVAADYGVTTNVTGNALWLEASGVWDTAAGVWPHGVDDRDGDHIPDWWESVYGADEPTGDPDGDGLGNYYEFLSQTDPGKVDTDGDNTDDGFERLVISAGVTNDLTNLEEQKFGSDPRLLDTDDDGVTDSIEIKGGAAGSEWAEVLWPVSDPTSPLQNTNAAPQVLRRSLALDGASRVLVPAFLKYAMPAWTVEAWVNPDAATVGRAVVVRRAVMDLGGGEEALNYELGVWENAGDIRPYVCYVTTNGLTNVVGGVAGASSSGDIRIPSNQWTHIAGSFDALGGAMLLYINGMPVGSSRVEKVKDYPPVTGPNPAAIEVTLGGGSTNSGAVVNGFVGHIDEIRFMASAVPRATIFDQYRTADASLLGGYEAGRGSVPGTERVSMLSVEKALEKEHISNELLVRFKPGVTAQARVAVHQRVGCTVKSALKIVPVQVVQVAGGASLAAKLAAYRAEPDVLYVEPNYEIKAFKTPNDADFGLLWGLHNSGQFGGTEDADIDAPEAWEKTTGSRNVLVAVIDTGVDYAHPDLAANMWANPGEIAGNGIDDDGNGYIDDVHGYDFLEDDGDPMDDHSHGTHVSGTIGGVANNGIGIAGINWNVQIMALRFMGASGGGALSDAIRCIEYAVAMGAKISNNSWGSYGYSQSLYDTIQAAGSAGHLFVAAAGNDANDNDGAWPAYPASYDLDNILAVAATDDNDQLAWFSNYGEESVDLSGPGVNIYSSVPGNRYEFFNGTSMACPHVAGAAALISAFRSGLSYAALKSMILNSVDKVDALTGRCVTGGRLNVDATMQGAGVSATAYFRCDDGGTTVEDLSVKNDALVGWRHAAVLQVAAAFDAGSYVDMTGDSDGDGMPEWFESAYGSADAVTDSDSDGLRDVYEYLAGTNPRLADSDNNDVEDALADSDLDGLSNVVEQDSQSDPGLRDTDDDGASDAAEYAGGSSPANALHPYTNMVLALTGNAEPVRAPNQPRFAISGSWTIEAWLWVTTPGESVLVTRSLGAKGTNYVLGVDSSNHAYVGFTSMAGIERRVTAPAALSGSNRWIHVAGVYDVDAHQLSIYVDGLKVNYTSTSIVVPAAQEAGASKVVLGDRVTGYLDDVRIWARAKAQGEVFDGFLQLLSGNEAGLVAYYRFEDRTSWAWGGPGTTSLEPGWSWGQIQEFAGGYARDWRSQWANAASIVTSGVSFVERMGFILTENDTDFDGLPDWWELTYFGNLFTTDGSGDYDRDGLRELAEYQAGLDPTLTYSYGGTVSDADLDTDRDGLSNVDEQDLYRSNPGRMDTDDDGVDDGTEVNYATSPWHPMSVFSARTNLFNLAERKSLDMGQVDEAGIEVPVNEAITYVDEYGLERHTRTNRFAFSTDGWTVEAWVYVEGDGNGDLFAFDAVQGHSFKLALTNGSPYGVIYQGNTIIEEVGGVVRQATNGSWIGSSPLQSNRWTHLAMVWAPDSNSLRLYEDGTLLFGQMTLAVANIVKGRAFVARGFDDGHLDELRVWGRARETQEVEDWYEKIFPSPGYVVPPADGWVPAHWGPYRSDWTTIRNDIYELPWYRATYEFGQPLLLYYRFDDGGRYIEDFAHLNDEWYFVRGPVTADPAVNVYGWDDGDGDGLPEWWIDIHGLDRYPTQLLGPYHELDPLTGTDYPVTYAAGWTTAVGTPGINRGIYYNYDWSPDVYNVNIYKFNVWLDVNPDFAPTNAAGTNGPNDGLDGNYRGRGEYNSEWDVPVWQDDGRWFTPDGTLGWTGMYFNDADADQMYSLGEDIWRERWNPDAAEDPVFNVQEVVGIMYFRSFVAYASIGDHTSWSIVDPGNTNEVTDPELNRYASTKSTHVGHDGMYSCFTKYVQIDRDPRSASMRIALYGVDDWTLWVNGNEYEPEADPDGSKLVGLLHKGRNQLYLYSDNSVAWLIDEMNVHYTTDYVREWTAMKFDMTMTVNDEELVVRGDTTILDPRAVWHGQAWSTYYNTYYVSPLPDLDARLVYHQDYGVPRDEDRDGMENINELGVNTNPRDDDTDNDGIPDADEDYDGDGLTNYEEQRAASDPRLPDTDDDTIGDSLEKATYGDPTDSTIALRPKALWLPGGATNYIEMPIQERFSPASWTFEAWINPTNGWAGGGTLIRRQVGIVPGLTQETYVVRVTTNGLLQAGFGNVWLTATGAVYHYNVYGSGTNWSKVLVPGAGTNLLAVGTNLTSLLASGSNWTHVAVTYDSEVRGLILYINGREAAKTNSAEIPMRYGNGPIVQRIGEDFAGMIEELRFWNNARTRADVSNQMYTVLDGDELGLVAYYRFDDGSSDLRTATTGVSGLPEWKKGQVEDYVISYAADWKELWRHAGSVNGEAGFTNMYSWSSPIPIVTDSDGDGLPDWWESYYVNCMNAYDAAPPYGRDDDVDRDGFSNMDEFLAGTDPCTPDTVLAYWSDLIADNKLDIQVGDTIPVTIAMAAQSSNATFSGTVMSSDDSLIEVTPEQVNVDGVNQDVVLVTGVAQSFGETAHNGYVIIQNVTGSGDGVKVPVQVYNGIRLQMTMSAASASNVVAGDTATVTLRRQRSIAGLLSMPLVVQLASTDSSLATVPETVTIPAGLDEIWFPVSGVKPTESVTIQAIAVGYPVATMPVRVTAPAVTMSPNPITIELDGAGNVVLMRRFDQVGAPLTVSMMSEDTSVFTVSSPTVTFPATIASVMFGITGTGAGGSAALVARLGTNELGRVIVNVSAATLRMNPAMTSVMAGNSRTFAVSRSAGTMAELVVTLRNSDPQRILMQDSVTIPAGLDAATFEVQGVESSYPNYITLIASADGYPAASAVLMVTDYQVSIQPTNTSLAVGDMTTLVIDRPLTLSDRDAVFTIGNGNAAALSAPASVAMSNGQTIASVPLVGLRTSPGVMLSVSAENYASAACVVDVIDPVLEFVPPVGLTVEIDGANTVTVRRVTGAGTNLTVSLASSSVDLMRLGRSMNDDFGKGAGTASLAIPQGMRTAAAFVLGCSDTNRVGSNVVLTASVGTYRTNVTVTLVNKVVRIKRVNWYDNDYDMEYTANDEVELVFNSRMSNETVNVTNGNIRLMDKAGSMYSATVAGTWGTNASVRAVSEVTNRFIVVLTNGPVLPRGLMAVDATTNALSALGEMEQGSAVDLPLYPVGYDSDGDGMPNEWETDNDLDPFIAEGPNGAYGDPDGDGLWNLWEYYADTNPKLADTDADGTWDPLEDSDGDKLLNGDEQLAGSHAGLRDTDDDTVPDASEFVWSGTAGANATNSMRPTVNRVLSLGGGVGDCVTFPVEERFRMEGDWTLQARVCARVSWTNGMALIRYQIGPGVVKTNLGVVVVERRVGMRTVTEGTNSWQNLADNYVLAVDQNGRVTAGFGDTWVLDATPLPSDGRTWSDLAAVYDQTNAVLRLYVNGVLRAEQVSAERPQPRGLGPVTQRIGAGLNGQMDEVRIWSVALSGEQVRQSLVAPVANGASGLALYYRCDDGTSYDGVSHGVSDRMGWSVGQVEDFAVTNGMDWRFGWRHAGTFRGAVQMVEPRVAVVSVSSTNANGTYYPGDVLNVNVTFNEAVTVGTPVIQLETGGDDQYAFYDFGSGTTTIHFNYTIQSNDWNLDLDYWGPSALLANGLPVRDSTGAVVNLRLPLPGAVGSLSWNKDIFVDPPRRDAYVNGVETAWLFEHFARVNGVDVNADSDGDGASNWKEYLCGTEPNDASSVLAFKAPAVTPNGVVVQWKALIGQKYTVQYADDLRTGWQSRGDWTELPATATVMSVVDDTVPAGSAQRRYYRVMQVISE